MLEGSTEARRNPRQVLRVGDTAGVAVLFPVLVRKPSCGDDTVCHRHRGNDDPYSSVSKLGEGFVVKLEKPDVLTFAVSRVAVDILSRSIVNV